MSGGGGGGAAGGGAGGVCLAYIKGIMHTPPPPPFTVSMSMIVNISIIASRKILLLLLFCIGRFSLFICEAKKLPTTPKRVTKKLNSGGTAHTLLGVFLVG